MDYGLKCRRYIPQIHRPRRHSKWPAHHPHLIKKMAAITIARN
jgi:hypothetical protein